MNLINEFSKNWQGWDAQHLLLLSFLIETKEEKHQRDPRSPIIWEEVVS